MSGKTAQTGKSGSFFREVQIEFLIHELKGPISIIETGLRSLLEKQEKFGPLSEKQIRTLHRALKNTKKTNDMVNQLLEIGRSESGCFLCCRFHPAKAVGDVLMEELETITMVTGTANSEQHRYEAFEANSIFLSISREAADIDILQDEIKFRQIIGNLIKNALRHRKKRLDIAVGMESNSVVIEVADDGPGVKPEHHELIFRRYTQADPDPTLDRKGHGLGLAGALILARSLGGDIELKSEAGSGAAFRVRLPITMDQPKVPDHCEI